MLEQGSFFARMRGIIVKASADLILLHLIRAPPMREIQNVNRRTRIPQWAIRWVVDQIAERFSPRRIILFGSYAAGQPSAGKRR